MNEGKYRGLLRASVGFRIPPRGIRGDLRRESRLGINVAPQDSSRGL